MMGFAAFMKVVCMGESAWKEHRSVQVAREGESRLKAK